MAQKNATPEELDGQCKVDCRPFLKWVGGKRQLLPELLSRVPPRFNRYFGPFVGGGALLFALQPKVAFASDINAELVNAYEAVRDDVDGVISRLKSHMYDAEHFYNVRNADRLPSFRRWSSTRRAARLIFLNKTCFNGLYRVNSRGFFNVPLGRYANPTILDELNLRACSRALRRVSVRHAGFDWVVDGARKGDFVYFDPPYVPLSATSSFTTYSSEGFDFEMQRNLYRACCSLDRKGVKFMLSNSSAPFVLDLYKAFNLELVRASRFINSKKDLRGDVDESLVTNY